MKCEICKNKIEEIFLKKIVGTVVKNKEGKRHTICGRCQQKLGSKENILKEL